MAGPKRLQWGLGTAVLATLAFLSFKPANQDELQAVAWRQMIADLKLTRPIAFETIDHVDGAKLMSYVPTVPLKEIAQSKKESRLVDAKGNSCTKIQTRSLKLAGWNRWEIKVASDFGLGEVRGRVYSLQSIFGRWWLIETKDEWVT